MKSEGRRRRAAPMPETVNAEVARLIQDQRKAAGLTQIDLARQVGTTQSVISRLEDPSYRGHSLSMLLRIAAALNRRVKVLMTEAPQPSRKKPSLSLEEFLDLMKLPEEERLRVYRDRAGRQD